MIALLYALTPISLIDSLSLLPFAVVVLAVLLSGPKPYLSSVSFLLGVVLSYFAAGVLIGFGLGALLQGVTATIVHWFNNPSAIDYILSMVVGIALILLGYRCRGRFGTSGTRSGRPLFVSGEESSTWGLIPTSRRTPSGPPDDR